MNVTLKMDDELCRRARHRAVDADLSLSKWVARVVAKELEASPSPNQTMAERLGMDDDHDLMEFVPDRNKSAERPLQFP